MNLRFLETFVWVARLKSFRLTAQKLFTTQAAVSSRIAALEADLGVKLLLRDSRGVSLTPEGSKVLEHAERMLETGQMQVNRRWRDYEEMSTRTAAEFAADAKE